MARRGANEQGRDMVIRSSTDPVRHAQKQLSRLYAGDDAEQQARSWALGVLEGKGLDPARAPLRSLRALRRQDRRLGAVTARYLVDLAAGRSPSPRSGPDNPHVL